MRKTDDTDVDLCKCRGMLTDNIQFEFEATLTFDDGLVLTASMPYTQQIAVFVDGAPPPTCNIQHRFPINLS